MIPSDVIEELYGGDPEDFVTTRAARMRDVRDQGDREVADRIGELRKPTVAAWAVNRLTRERPAEVDRLVELGVRLRAAQAELDPDELRRLRPERDAAVEGFTRAARFVADAHDRPLSVLATAAVRATAVAALADEKASAAVAGGALVRTLEYSGFGEVDLSDAVAAQVAAQVAAGRRHAPPAEDEDEAGPDIDGGEDVESNDDAGAERSRVDGSARRRRRERLTEELAQADRVLAEASLVEAEAVRRAEKSAGRAAELRRLLENAEEENAQRQEAAREATTAREEAAAAHARARTRLDRADAE